MSDCRHVPFPSESLVLKTSFPPRTECRLCHEMYNCDLSGYPLTGGTLPQVLDPQWEFVERPGYFGRRRDEKMAAYNTLWGEGNWKLCWLVTHHDGRVEENTFEEACKKYYERSYVEYLKKRPEDVDFICKFGECIDNDETNIESGLDYMKQESWATHIQDIAVRNALKLLGRKFEGNRYKVLVIRSQDSAGFRFNPGNVPFYRPELIMHPSKAPKWAQMDSVEDFWQSNKVLMRKKS